MADRQEQIVVVTPQQRTPGPSTPGMVRQQAVATDALWSHLKLNGVAPSRRG